MAPGEHTVRSLHGLYPNVSSKFTGRPRGTLLRPRKWEPAVWDASVLTFNRNRPTLGKPSFSSSVLELRTGRASPLTQSPSVCRRFPQPLTPWLSLSLLVVPLLRQTPMKPPVTRHERNGRQTPSLGDLSPGWEESHGDEEKQAEGRCCTSRGMDGSLRRSFQKEVATLEDSCKKKELHGKSKVEAEGLRGEQEQVRAFRQGSGRFQKARGNQLFYLSPKPGLMYPPPNAEGPSLAIPGRCSSSERL